MVGLGGGEGELADVAAAEQRVEPGIGARPERIEDAGQRALEIGGGGGSAVDRA